VLCRINMNFAMLVTLPRNIGRAGSASNRGSVAPRSLTLPARQALPELLLLAHELEAHVVADLPILACDPLALEMVFVTNRQGCIMHVAVVARFQIRSVEKLEGDLVDLATRLRSQPRLIAQHAVVREDQALAVEVVHGDHFLFGSRKQRFLDGVSARGDAD